MKTNSLHDRIAEAYGFCTACKHFIPEKDTDAEHKISAGNGLAGACGYPAFFAYGCALVTNTTTCPRFETMEV